MHYRLASPTIALKHGAEGQFLLFTVPEQAIVSVSGKPDATGLVSVAYGEESLLMFLRDIQERGMRIADRRASA